MLLPATWVLHRPCQAHATAKLSDAIGRGRSPATVRDRRFTLPDWLAADAIVVVVQALWIRGEDGEAALVGDGAALVERGTRWNTGAIVWISRIAI